jgi:hypothetical protein
MSGPARFNPCVTCCAIATLSLLIAGPSAAQCDLELPVPDSVGAGGYFGTAVAVDGDLVVVGAPLDTGLEWASGAIYVFRLDGDQWIDAERLIADDGQVADMMGVSVDISGDRIVAGAWFDDDHGSNSGAAYVFRNQGDGWIQEAKLTKPDPGPEDAFGRTVAIDGDRIVVGAPLDDDAGPSSGTVTSFVHENGAWVHEITLVSPSGSDGDEFGLGLDLRGEQLLIGSPWSGDGTGHADLFEPGADGQWEHAAVFLHPDAGPGEYFGFEPALGNGRLALGAYLDDQGSPSGRVYVYEQATDGSWAMQQAISPGASNEAEQFGISIDLESDVMAIGADLAGTTGEVHLYDLQGGDWQLRSILQPESLNAGAEFGWFVDLDGDLLVVGAYAADLDGMERGAAWVYEGMQVECNCPGDTDGNGSVDVSDLLAVIAAWNTSGGSADVNGDGIVDVTDLLQIIAGWGDCG